MTGFIIYFTLLSIVHLFFCYFGMHTPRKLTKPLLLTSLAACYACAAKPVDGAVLAALICGLAGDILLIWEKNDKFFIPGALSFTLGHGLYALSAPKTWLVFSSQPEKNPTPVFPLGKAGDHSVKNFFQKRA